MLKQIFNFLFHTHKYKIEDKIQYPNGTVYVQVCIECGNIKHTSVLK